MPPVTFQRTKFETVLTDVETQLQNAGFKHFVYAEGNDDPDGFLGDNQIAITIDSMTPDEGTLEGTGTRGNILIRKMQFHLMNRCNLDEGSRGKKAILQHLAMEEKILTALHIYMPSNANGILVQGARFAGSTKPTFKQGWTKSTMQFDFNYAGWLQSDS